MVPLYYLSLTCRSIPHRRAHKKGRNSHPRDFSSSPTMRLFRSIIYVENKENLQTYIASTTTTKKTGIHEQPALLFHAATNTSQTHTKKRNEKLVLICQPSLYPQPSELGPEALDFSHRLPWRRKVEHKKEQGL